MLQCMASLPVSIEVPAAFDRINLPVNSYLVRLHHLLFVYNMIL